MWVYYNLIIFHNLLLLCIKYKHDHKYISKISEEDFLKGLYTKKKKEVSQKKKTLK